MPSDYLAFQWWDTIQGLCSYVRGVLCSNALFTGVGVGSTTASALSATAAFVFKDLAGMLGSILFSYAQGAKLDADEKQWRYAGCGGGFGSVFFMCSIHLVLVFLHIHPPHT